MKQEINQTVREFMPHEIALNLERKGKLAPVSDESTLYKHARGFVEGAILVALAGGFFPADLITKFEILHGIPTLLTITGLYSMFDHSNRVYNYPNKKEDSTYFIEKGYNVYKKLRGLKENER